jgi:hypothetical protein
MPENLLIKINNDQENLPWLDESHFLFGEYPCIIYAELKIEVLERKIEVLERKIEVLELSEWLN